MTHWACMAEGLLLAGVLLSWHRIHPDSYHKFEDRWLSIGAWWAQQQLYWPLLALLAMGCAPLANGEESLEIVSGCQDEVFRLAISGRERASCDAGSRLEVLADDRGYLAICRCVKKARAAPARKWFEKSRHTQAEEPLPEVEVEKPLSKIQEKNDGAVGDGGGRP